MWNWSYTTCAAGQCIFTSAAYAAVTSIAAALILPQRSGPSNSKNGL